MLRAFIHPSIREAHMNQDSEEIVQDTPVEETVIPVIEEEVVAGARPVKTGSVRVDKHVEKRIRRLETPLLHEDVEVRRVPVNRVVSEAPAVRKKGDTVIVPVVEEELIVTKRLILKEEIHLVKHHTKDRFVKEVELNRERAEVHRLDAEGRIIDPGPAPSRPPRRPLRDRERP
jgi:uncharacterized protein (TIGR02271 family)